MSDEIKIERIPMTGLSAEHLDSIEVHGWGIVRRRTMTREEFAQEYMQQPGPVAEPPDPLIAKRNEFYQRFNPEAAERHWRRWLEQRAEIDREFDRTHPYWQEYIKTKDGRS